MQKHIEVERHRLSLELNDNVCEALEFNVKH
jgi:hypothetical protein